MNGGNAVDYNTRPTTGTWRYTGNDTYFVIEERNTSNTEFEGDAKDDDQIARNNQIGKGQAQTVNIGGTDRQVLWDYTFEVTDGISSWRVGVIDVDLNNDNDVNDPGEDGYFLVFPDGMPPEGQDLSIGTFFEDGASTPHLDLGATVVCFAEGTHIETIGGTRSIETLEPGDMVLTRDAGFQPLRWCGRTEVMAERDLAPMVISKGALGNATELVVSPQHAILLDDWRAELLYGSPEVLVRAVDLLGHDGIYRRPGGRIAYHHILFDAHQLVSASGLWSESLYPGDMTLQTVNCQARDEIKTLFPDLKGYGPKAARCLRHFEAVCLAA